MCNCSRSRVDLKKANKVMGNPNLYFRFEAKSKKQEPVILETHEVESVQTQVRLFRPSSSFLVLGPVHF